VSRRFPHPSTGSPPGSPRTGLDRGAGSDAPESGAQPVKVSRFVRETLEAYASEAVADEILRRALARSGSRTLPTTSAELAELIDVHLARAAADALGGEPAEAIRQRLQPLVAVVAQIAGPRNSDRPTWEDASMDPAGRTPTREIAIKPFSVVLVVGSEADVATRLKGQLDSRTAVIPVESAPVLLRDLRLLRAQPRMLVLDLRRQHALLDAVRGEPELLDGAIVALWGSAADADDFRRTFPRAKLIRCAPDASIADLASIARLGPGG
jgi:hypothetical protein